jgi:hypothetical protein
MPLEDTSHPSLFAKEFVAKLKDYMNTPENDAVQRISKALASSDPNDAISKLSRLFNLMVENADFSEEMLTNEYNNIAALPPNEVEAYSKNVIKETALLLFDSEDNKLKTLKPEIANIIPELTELTALCIKAETSIEDMLLKAIAALHAMCVLGEISKHMPTVSHRTGTAADIKQLEVLNKKGEAIENVQRTITQNNLFSDNTLSAGLTAIELQQSLSTVLDEIRHLKQSVQIYLKTLFSLPDRNLDELTSNSDKRAAYLAQPTSRPHEKELEKIINTYKTLKNQEDIIDDQLDRATNLTEKDVGFNKIEPELLKSQNTVRGLFPVLDIIALENTILDATIKIKQYLDYQADTLPDDHHVPLLGHMQEGLNTLAEYIEQLPKLSEPNNDPESLKKLSQTIQDTLRTPTFQLVEKFQTLCNLDGWEEQNEARALTDSINLLTEELFKSAIDPSVLTKQYKTQLNEMKSKQIIETTEQTAEPVATPST